MRRRGRVGLSLIVTAAATAAIMIAGGYFRGLPMLATQLPVLAGPIGMPLLVATMQRTHAARLWTVVAVILAAGWGYVVYLDAGQSKHAGPSFAVMIGWMTSIIALAVALVWIVAARIAVILAGRRRSSLAE